MKIIRICALVLLCAIANAGVLTYGDMDCLGFACYGAADPTAGATLQGLSANVVTFASNSFGHVYPFLPSGDFPGTDTMYVGSVQTGAHDGYSVAADRVNGPQVLVLDYSSLVGPGETVTSLTLGIAADDFQFPAYGQPFTATVNGNVNATLTSTLNSHDLGGPIVQFLTIGLDPSIDTPGHILTLSIDEGGDGGDGWATDFLTVGVTTSNSAVPEPSTWGLLGGGMLSGIALVRRRQLRYRP